MNIKSLIGKWSSVSAAAAVLLGSSNRASAIKMDSDSETAKLGDGDPYEPLILKPPAVKVIPEERFAGHVSHSSHASHASHASHYSGSTGYTPYSTPTASPSYSPPIQMPSPGTGMTSIELADGTIIYGTLLTKSAAGITFRGSDGKDYKVQRSGLSARSISALGLPPEQSLTVATPPQPTATPIVDTTDIAALRKKNDELEQSVAKLNNEVAALREQLQSKPINSPAASASRQTPAVDSPSMTYRVVGISEGNYLNIREGPGSTYPTIVRLRPGDRGITVQPDRITNGRTVWQKISFGRYTGWANSEYLSPDYSSR